MALAVALCMAIGSSAQAFDETKYPDLKGQWQRVGPPRWADPSKAPLTAEYQAIFESNLKQLATGGQDYNPQIGCFPSGMPRMMIAYEPLEFIVTPDVTYVRSDHLTEFRRIYTDARAWPSMLIPSYTGHSIGKWIDEDGDGRYDVLAVETRGFKGPRTFDASGIPFHKDNQTIVKERIYLDKANSNTLYDEITVIDNALTRPWTTTKKYVRGPNRNPVWGESVCAEGNQHVVIEDEPYMLSSDG